MTQGKDICQVKDCSEKALLLCAFSIMMALYGQKYRTFSGQIDWQMHFCMGTANKTSVCNPLI